MALNNHVEKFTLDMAPGGIAPVLNVSQGDTGRAYTADMYWGGASYDASGLTVRLRGRKKDNTVFDYALPTPSGTKVSFDLEDKEQVTIIPGNVECELVFTDSDSRVVGTANFVFIVEEAPYDPDAPSQSIVQGLEDMVDASVAEQAPGVVDNWFETEAATSPGFTDLVDNAVDEWFGDDADAQATIANSIESWLNDHPEATTTVQDGAITYAKLNDSLKTYVTPEMFGAKGNGVDDDTAAWQAAVDVGVQVVALHNTYRCGQIDVTKNISIDCNNATFVCTAEKLFNCHGTVTETVENAPDYVKNADYTLPNDNYTGFAMLKSADNIITTRTYYYGGFATMFKDGVCHAQKPVSFTGVTVEKVNPITCKIANVGSVKHPNNPNYNYTVYCLYGYMCEFSHLKETGDKYNVVLLECCLRCRIGYIAGKISYSGSVANYYPLQLIDTSESYTHDCDVLSDWWHSWTTGGNYLCFDNIVERCTFKIGTGGTAFADHDNAIGTVLLDSDCDGVVLAGNGKAKNVRIYSHLNGKDDTRYSCSLGFYPTNLDGCNNFYAENIEYIIDPAKKPNQSITHGFVIGFSAQTSGNNFVINNVTIKDIYGDAATSSCPYIAPGTNIAESVTFNGNWILDNVIGRFITANDEIMNWDNCDIIVQNCERRGTEGFMTAQSGMPPRSMRRFVVRDSVITSLRGEFNYLELHNVRSFTPGQQLGVISGGTLIADNIDKIGETYIKSFENAQINNMFFNPYYLWVYAIHNQYFSIYGRTEANGIVNYTL